MPRAYLLLGDCGTLCLSFWSLLHLNVLAGALAQYRMNSRRKSSTSSQEAVEERMSQRRNGSISSTTRWVRSICRVSGGSWKDCLHRCDSRAFLGALKKAIIWRVCSMPSSRTSWFDHWLVMWAMGLSPCIYGPTYLRSTNRLFICMHIYTQPKGEHWHYQ